MKIGTRTVLFGVHQFAIHPWFVALGWWKLYGFPWDVRLWLAFFLHDLGYIGKPNLDGPEGEEHPEWAARVMKRFFGDQWADLCRYHSRFLAKRDGKPYSRLCAADKFAIAICPGWIYLPLARLTGELGEYMKGKGARTPAGERSSRTWYRDVQRYCRAWAIEHADGRLDTWTGTKRDLAMELSRKEDEFGG